MMVSLKAPSPEDAATRYVSEHTTPSSVRRQSAWPPRRPAAAIAVMGATEIKSPVRPRQSPQGDVQRAPHRRDHAMRTQRGAHRHGPELGHRAGPEPLCPEQVERGVVVEAYAQKPYAAAGEERQRSSRERRGHLRSGPPRRKALRAVAPGTQGSRSGQHRTRR